MVEQVVEGPRQQALGLAPRVVDETAVWMVKVEDGTVVPVAAETFLAPSMAAPLVLMGEGGPVGVFASGEWRWALDSRAFAVGLATEAIGG